MKTAFSFGAVNTASSLPGNMNFYYRWFWEDMVDWVAATGFDSIALPMIPNAFNVGRGGAPRCTLAVNTKYGSAAGYLSFLNDHGVNDVCAISISAQATLADMFESGRSFEELYELLYEHADDVSDMVAALKGTALVVSPTPGIGNLKEYLGDDDAAFDRHFKEAAACINRIGEMTAAKGVRTCVKNDFWTLARGAKIDELFRQLDAKNVSFAEDTAMLYIGGVDPVEYAGKYKDNMGCVFFTDSAFVDENNNYASKTPEYPQEGAQQRCYNDLGFGKVDIAGVYNTLKANNYDGIAILEPRYTTNVPRAMLRTRTYWTKLTKED